MQRENHRDFIELLRKDGNQAVIIKDTIERGDHVVFKLIDDTYMALDREEQKVLLSESQTSQILSIEDEKDRSFILGKVIKMNVTQGTLNHC